MARNAVVTKDGWGVSYTTESGVEGVRLSVYKFPMNWKMGKPYRKGELDGRRYSSVEEASQAALDHGYLQRVVNCWCLKCRTLHTFLGKKSSFCPVHKFFNGSEE